VLEVDTAGEVDVAALAAQVVAAARRGVDRLVAPPGITALLRGSDDPQETL